MYVLYPHNSLVIFKSTTFITRRVSHSIMLVKIIIILMLLFIFGSLFTGFYHLMKGKQNENVVKSLTWRISISLLLFILLMIGFFTGIIGAPNPHP